MHKIALYCKSFSRDLTRVALLWKSIQKFNVDKIPFFVSVPRHEVHLFEEIVSSGAVVLADEDLAGDPGRLRQDWSTQQIIKQKFGLSGLCENYLCLDSDSYFIRPFGVDDFIVPGTNICYTVMHEQKELFGYTINKTHQLGFDPIESFKRDRYKVMDVFGREGRIYDFGPAPVLWNCDVWKSFETDYLKPNNLTFIDCIRMVPSEFTWYGEFLLADRTIDIRPIEPIFKVFHYIGQYQEAKAAGYKTDDFAKIYSGFVMQGNAMNMPLTFD